MRITERANPNVPRSPAPRATGLPLVLTFRRNVTYVTLRYVLRRGKLYVCLRTLACPGSCGGPYSESPFRHQLFSAIDVGRTLVESAHLVTSNSSRSGGSD